MPATLSIITTSSRAEERGRAIGVWAATAGVGVALGPLTGGFLLEHFYWGSIFLVNIPIVVVGAHRRRLPDPDLEGPVGAAARPGRRGALDRRARRARLRDHRGAARRAGPARRSSAASSLGARAARRVRRGGRRTPTTRCSTSRSSRTRGSPPRARASRSFLRDVRLDLPAHAVPAVRARATRRSRPACGFLPLARHDDGRRAAERADRRAVRHEARRRHRACARRPSRLAARWRRSASTARYWPDVVWRHDAHGRAAWRLTMAPATESIMGSLPLAKAGVGSAVNDTTRQVGGALGVAVIGSVLAVGLRLQGRRVPAGKPVPSGTAAAAQAVARPRAAGEQAGARPRRHRHRRRSSTACTSGCWLPPAWPSSVRSSRSCGCRLVPATTPSPRACPTPRPRAGRHGLGGRAMDADAVGVPEGGEGVQGSRGRGGRGRRGAPARPPAQCRGRRGDPRGRGRALRRGRARGTHRRGRGGTRGRGQGHDLPPVPVQGRPRGGGRPLLHPGPGAASRHRLDARRPARARRRPDRDPHHHPARAGAPDPGRGAAPGSPSSTAPTPTSSPRSGPGAPSSSAGPSSAATSAPTSTPSWRSTPT